MKKISFVFFIISTNLLAQKFNFGPIISVYNEKSIGSEQINNQYKIDYGGNQTKERLKFGVFLEYQILKNISTSTNFQFSKPINEISVFGYGTDTGQNKLISYAENRFNSELLINYKVIEFKNSTKFLVITGIDYNKVLSFEDNFVLFTNPVDIEYGEILNLAGNSLKKDYLRYVFGIKLEYKKFYIGLNYNTKAIGSIANTFNFKNSNYYNLVSNRAINFNIGFKIR